MLSCHADDVMNGMAYEALELCGHVNGVNDRQCDVVDEGCRNEGPAQACTA